MNNKTLFGGTLSLIFIIIFLLISIAYLADYIMNDKYHIEYIINQEGLHYMEQYDPTLDFQINLLNTDNLSLSDRFCIYDLRRDRFLDINEKFSSKVSDIRLGIFYICENESCLLNEDDESYLGYTALIRYQGYTFDHQGNIPLYKSDDIEYNSNNFVFFQKPLFEFMEWGIIKYYEKKYFLSVLSYIFGNEGEELIGGYIKNRDYFFADGILDPDDEMIYDNQHAYHLHQKYHRSNRNTLLHLQNFSYHRFHHIELLLHGAKLLKVNANLDDYQLPESHNLPPPKSLKLLHHFCHDERMLHLCVSQL
jgi:hypothetical protein